MPTVAQAIEQTRETSNIRVFAHTILDLNQYALDEQRRTGKRPTHAELIDRAVGQYLNRGEEELGMGFVQQLHADREATERKRALDDWRYRNSGAVAIPKELNIDPRIVRARIEGKRRDTPTLQLERRLADLGCPGFEKYRIEKAS